MITKHLQKRIFYVNQNEILSGYVDGQPASDLEERFSRGLAKRQLQRAFRFRINPLIGFTQIRMNIIGELEIDFLVWSGGQIYPINIDGEIGHFVKQWQIEEDAEKTIAINEAMRKLKARPLIRIPFHKLKNQTTTNNIISDIFDTVIPVQFPEDKVTMADKAEEIAKKVTEERNRSNA